MNRHLLAYFLAQPGELLWTIRQPSTPDQLEPVLRLTRFPQRSEPECQKVTPSRRRLRLRIVGANRGACVTSLYEELQWDQTTSQLVLDEIYQHI